VAYTQAIGPSVDFFVQFTPIWTMFRAEKYPGAQQLSFRASKAVEAGQNYNQSTITSPRWSQNLLVAFIQATGQSVDFFVQFTPIWTMFRAEKYPGAHQLTVDRQRQWRPAKTITTAPLLHPDGPRASSWRLPKRLGHLLSFSCSLHQFRPCFEPKSTLEFSD